MSNSKPYDLRFRLFNTDNQGIGLGLPLVVQQQRIAAAAAAAALPVPVSALKPPDSGSSHSHAIIPSAGGAIPDPSPSTNADAAINGSAVMLPARSGDSRGSTPSLSQLSPYLTYSMLPQAQIQAAQGLQSLYPGMTQNAGAQGSAINNGGQSPQLHSAQDHLTYTQQQLGYPAFGLPTAVAQGIQAPEDSGSEHHPLSQLRPRTSQTALQLQGWSSCYGELSSLQQGMHQQHPQGAHQNQPTVDDSFHDDGGTTGDPNAGSREATQLSPLLLSSVVDRQFPIQHPQQSPNITNQHSNTLRYAQQERLTAGVFNNPYHLGREHESIPNSPTHVCKPSPHVPNPVRRLNPLQTVAAANHSLGGGGALLPTEGPTSHRPCHPIIIRIPFTNQDGQSGHYKVVTQPDGRIAVPPGLNYAQRQSFISAVQEAYHNAIHSRIPLQWWQNQPPAPFDQPTLHHVQGASPVMTQAVSQLMGQQQHHPQVRHVQLQAQAVSQSISPHFRAIQQAALGVVGGIPAVPPIPQMVAAFDLLRGDASTGTFSMPTPTTSGLSPPEQAPDALFLPVTAAQNLHLQGTSFLTSPALMEANLPQISSSAFGSHEPEASPPLQEIPLPSVFENKDDFLAANKRLLITIGDNSFNLNPKDLGKSEVMGLSDYGYEHDGVIKCDIAGHGSKDIQVLLMVRFPNGEATDPTTVGPKTEDRGTCETGDPPLETEIMKEPSHQASKSKNKAPKKAKDQRPDGECSTDGDGVVGDETRDVDHADTGAAGAEEHASPVPRPEDNTRKRRRCTNPVGGQTSLAAATSKLPGSSSEAAGTVTTMMASHGLMTVIALPPSNKKGATARCAEPPAKRTRRSETSKASEGSFGSL